MSYVHDLRVDLVDEGSQRSVASFWGDTSVGCQVLHHVEVTAGIVRQTCEHQMIRLYRGNYAAL